MKSPVVASILRSHTSRTHPLMIAEVCSGSGHGLIGVTFAPGKKQRYAATGLWDRDIATDLDAIAAWNAAAVITLVEEHELDALQITDLGREVRRRHMEWHHWPIVDVSVPCERFEAGWAEDSQGIQALLQGGSNVLVHCKGGLGRAGMVAARLMVQLGSDPAKAIASVRAVRPGAIQTPSQEAWVHAGQVALPAEPSRSDEAIRDRARGALLGLAVGDAVGTTIEFTPKPDYAVLDDMVGGGPFRLKPGHL